MTPETQETAPPAPPAQPWQILCGLIVSGFLLALPGGLLTLWGYHIHPDFAVAGNYFLVLGIGLAGGAWLAERLAHRVALGPLLGAGSFVAAFALLLLSVAAPPSQIWYQCCALLVTGFAAGIVNTAVLEGIGDCYASNPATITLMAGVAFGGGSVVAALLLAQSFGEDGAVVLLAVSALVPAASAWAFTRLNIHRAEVPDLSLTRAVADIRSPLAILFALLLFFQFANEWSLAGWLPVFLVDRLGLSPSTAVNLLAIYWLALMLGRLVVSRLLRLFSHGRLLAASAACALLGCTALMAAENRFGVITGLLLTGAGFSAIYPLAAEKIASRFSYYHPGYFNGIFSAALMGGILSPFVLGHIAESRGLSVVPLAAFIGSCAVFALVPLLWLGRKVSGP